MSFRKIIQRVALISALLASFSSFAYENIEVNKNGVTLAGYDAVAYFTENKAVEGSAKFTATYNNAIYYFSSKKNRELFKAEPAKYAPQYGGFCAYGAALGKKFDVNGKAFEIVDGKLYVNKNENVYETWAEDKAENIATADTEWQRIEFVPEADL